MNNRGVTFLEMILVLVIIAIGASLALPRLRMGVENREAKAVLETLRSISHAIRMYETTKGTLPANLTALETMDFLTGTRYLDPSEYAFRPPYNYSYNGITAPDRIVASRPTRTITLFRCQNLKSADGSVVDSAGFLTLPAPAGC